MVTRLSRFLLALGLLCLAASAQNFTISVSTNYVLVGAPITITTSTLPGSTRVTFFDAGNVSGSTPCGAANVTSNTSACANLGQGQAPSGGGPVSIQVPSFTQGKHLLNACSASSCSTNAVSVTSVVSTTLNVSSSPSPSNVCTPVTITATISPANAAGTVKFFDGSPNAVAEIALSGGAASYNTSALAPGPHRLQAQYNPGDNLFASSSAETDPTVNGTSSLTLSSNPNPSAANQTVVLTLLAAPTTCPGLPFTPLTGTVSFYDGSNSLGGSDVGSGNLTFNVSNLTQGPHALSATYSGDFRYGAASSNTVNQVVGPGSGPAATTISLNSAPNPSNFGQLVTLTATVTPPAATGSVSFFDGVSPLGPAALSNGVATLQVLNLSVGSHTLKASYPGNSSYTNSDSNQVTQTVVSGASLAPSGGTPQSAQINGPFASPLQVTYRNGSGNPQAGVTVTFTAPSSGPSATLSSATAMTDGNGIASVNATANGAAGSYLVTASALGLSANFSLTNQPPTGGGPNLAAGKTATQSSTYPGTPSPQAAVDGNTDGTFSNNSVTHTTNNDANPWWQVDLGSSTAISNVVVWNRTDCCGSRLNDYWVFVSDSPFQATDTPSTLSTRPGTFNSHQTSAPGPSTAISVNASGRYVRIQLNGSNYLSLAEVQVFGAAATNAAQGKPATQSSTLPGAPGAAAAVDGITDGNFTSNSVSHTNFEFAPWWQVDLQSSTAIGSITMWNRTDCCGSRLGDYWVFVSDTPFSATDTPATLQFRSGTFSSHQTNAPGPSTSIPVNSTGRYVRVQLNGSDYLSLAEVQVFSSAGGGSGTNLAAGKAASQSSLLPGAPSPAAAADGNTDGNFFDNSVIHTNLEFAPWWQVDLGASAPIASVKVWNRTDCCGSRLGDYWVFVSDTPFTASDTPATLQFRAGTFASHQTSAPGPSASIPVNASGRYVRVQLSGSDYLSLAEVQVFGSAGSGPVDQALGKQASESSTFPGTPSPSAAIDGNTDGNFGDSSITHTNLEAFAWWQVDLLSPVTVNTVTVWNRTDCCGTRLNDFWVFVSNTPFSALDTPATLQNRAGTFASHQTSAPSPSTAIPVGMQGRYVRIQLNGANYLSLAEVQVY